MKINLKYLSLLLLFTVPSILKAQISNNRSFPPEVMNKDAKKSFAHPDSTNFNFSISPDHFLLGTLNGYMGRLYLNSQKNTIDSYKGDSYLKNYIFEFIQQHYHTTPDSSGSYYIKDEKVATIINSYFDQKGKILVKELANENELYSYIIGKFLKYGEHLDDNIYKIRIANSFEGDLVYKSLKQLGCDKILYKRYRGYIPSSEYFCFEATPRMIKYFKTYAPLKDKMRNEFILSNLNNKSDTTIDDIKNAMEIIKNKEVSNAKQAFKNEIN